MKFQLSTLILAGALFCSTTYAVPTPNTQQKATGYIIKLSAPNTAARVTSFVTQYNVKSGMNTEATAVNKIKYTYESFDAVAGTFTPDFLAAFKAQHKDIAYIEEDGVMHALGDQPSPPSWGQVRVSERALDLSQDYVYPDEAGSGVDVYIIDTGLQANITDFGGRAVMAKSFVTTEAATDLNGHGTHVAGTIGSATYGIAKQVNLHGVKVLDGTGSGSYSDVVAGINYVAGLAAGKAGSIAINMSLGGPKAQSVDDAVNAAVQAGVVVIVAAGNDGGDACQNSPAGASGVFAVGATDNTDTIASFSDKGQCVKIFAPGVDIVSTWIGADGQTNTISGTSMATPHVVGVAAMYMSQKSYSSPQDVYADLQAHASTNWVQGLDTTTVNLLAFNDVTANLDSNAPSSTPKAAV